MINKPNFSKWTTGAFAGAAMLLVSSGVSASITMQNLTLNALTAGPSDIIRIHDPRRAPSKYYGDRRQNARHYYQKYYETGTIPRSRSGNKRKCVVFHNTATSYESAHEMQPWVRVPC